MEDTIVIQRELKYFLWHKDKRLLTAFISDLNLPGMPGLLSIFNPDTCQERTFCYIKSDKDEEGDIQAWHYTNSGSNLKLTIWND